MEDAFLQGLMDKLERIRVDLPSMYHAKVRGQGDFISAVEVERKLREGQANDALKTLRTHLTALYSLQDLRQQGSGQNHGNRVKGMAATEISIGRRAKEEYRRIRRILLVLGMPEDDSTYQELTDEDAKPFVVTPEQHRRGQSRKQMSWLWEDMSYVLEQPDEEIKEFMLDSEHYGPCLELSTDSMQNYDLFGSAAAQRRPAGRKSTISSVKRCTVPSGSSRTSSRRG